jgi:two-component system CheB/CheR fusion protein
MTSLGLRSISAAIDPQAESVLKHAVLPEVFANGGGGGIRVWIPQCATGQSAYLLTMLINDYVELHGLGSDVRVFATDSRPEQLSIARLGQYGTSLLGEKDTPRLQRYLQAGPAGYQVARRIRDCIIFSTHDLLNDPPFSNVDVVLADQAFQYPPKEAVRLLQIFHYSLSARGFLLLRPEHAPPELASFFRFVDSGVARGRTDRPSTLPPLLVAEPEQHRRSGVVRNWVRPSARERTSLSAAVERLLSQQYAPPCVVVDERGEIVHSVGRTSLYLQQPPGLPTNVLLDMLRPELVEVATALLRPSEDEQPRSSEPVAARLQGEDVEVHLVAHRLIEPGTNRMLQVLVFRETPSRTLLPAEGSQDGEKLRTELARALANAAELHEEFRTSSEELDASNQELRSMNEELEASNNELTEARDNLNAVNEQLQTVNEELKLRISEAQRANDDIRNLFESTQVATVFLDRQLCIVSFSPAAQDLFALIPADRGRPLTDIQPRFRYEDLIGDALHVLRAQEVREAPVQSLAKRWYILRMLPYFSAEKQVLGLVLTFVDVTLVKRAELEVERLRAALERQLGWLRSLIDMAPIGLGFYDPTDGRLRLSRRAAELAGLPLQDTPDDDPLGFTWSAASAASPEHGRLRDWMTSSEAIDGAAIELPLGDGASRHLVVHAEPVSKASELSGAKVSGLLDVTASVLGLRALEEARLRAAEAEVKLVFERRLERNKRLASLGTFATGIAHELNNPLANIALSADYAVATPDSERRAKLLENIRANALRCGRIVESVLRFARDEPTEHKPNPLNDVVQRAAELARADGASASLSVSFMLAEPSPVVDCNATELEQVFVNLLKNAAQARPNDCRVEIRSEVSDGSVKIFISDNGPGIPESALSRVFDPFFSTRRTTGGTGLGLSITQRIVATHQGSIRVDNGAGSGAVFEIQLPLASR